MGARDEGKAAAERRWVGASPYEWDGRDKLRTIRKPDGTRLDYSYDVFGRRVSKTRSGGPLEDKRVEFAWDGEVLAYELDTETGPRVFVHEPGGFEPILQQQGGETYLCVNDHLGMPKELIDGGGRLAWAAAHSAYGKVIATQGPADVEVEGGFVQSDGPRVESPFRLLGQVNDEDAELAWTRFRCFDAETGTWISTDPLEINGGLSLYGFDGSPSGVVDPLGLSTTGTRHYRYDPSVGRYRDPSGRLVSARNLPWPPNDGFATRSSGVVREGTVVNRIGRRSGRFASEGGTTVSERGLPPGSESLPFETYRATRPIPADVGTAGPVPEFGATGGAKQYLFDRPVQELIDDGSLEVL